MKFYGSGDDDMVRANFKTRVRETGFLAPKKHLLKGPNRQNLLPDISLPPPPAHTHYQTGIDAFMSSFRPFP